MGVTVNAIGAQKNICARCRVRRDRHKPLVFVCGIDRREAIVSGVHIRPRSGALRKGGCWRAVPLGAAEDQIRISCRLRKRYELRHWTESLVEAVKLITCAARA